MVEATYLWVVERKALRIRAFAIASAASGAVLLPISWLFPASDILSPALPVTLTILLAGGTFGIGARINGGCAFGTLSRLSGGALDYSGTLVGAALGAWLATRSLAGSPITDPVFQNLSILSVAAFLAFALLASPAFKRRHLQNFKSVFTDRRALLRPFTSMLVIGIGGGLMYALAGSWTHIAVIGRESAYHSGSATMGSDIKAIAGAMALFSGAFFAAWRSGRFEVTWPSATGWSKCVAGGTLMGGSAALIPGGNGALIVYGMPSGALNAWAAFASMLIVLAISFAWQQQKGPL